MLDLRYSSSDTSDTALIELAPTDTPPSQELADLDLNRYPLELFNSTVSPFLKGKGGRE